MSFIEIDLRENKTGKTNSVPHSHNYYELYFLLDGERRLSLGDRVFSITAPALCVIPPFCMHKTEGDAYKRININVSPEELSASELAIIKELESASIYKLSTDGYAPFFTLLNIAAEKPVNTTYDKPTKSFLHVLLYLLNSVGIVPIKYNAQAGQKKPLPVAMQVAAFIHTNYKESFTIKDLCERFYISKNTLAMQFKNLLHCSVMEYRQNVRISRAKELLASDKMSIKDIAEECGFSSANYFSLIFKSEVGLSPANYRKTK